jgi:hypothetical protein
LPRIRPVTIPKLSATSDEFSGRGWSVQMTAMAVRAESAYVWEDV